MNEAALWRRLLAEFLGRLLGGPGIGAALRARELDPSTEVTVDVADHKLLVTGANGTEELVGYDALVIGTGAVPVRPPIAGLIGDDPLGPDDGVHLLHSMGDTFAVMRTLEERQPNA